MAKAIVLLTISFLAGIATDRILLATGETPTGSSAPVTTQTVGPGTRPADRMDADITARIDALETRLDQEAQARSVLAEELQNILARLDETPGGGAEFGGQSVRLQARSASGYWGGSADQKVQRLVEAGIAADVAERLVRREAETQMENVTRRYESMHRQVQQAIAKGNADRVFGGGDPVAREFRAELGDDFYDRYLYATGRPNRIRAISVLPSGAGEKAGLRAGDMIVSYDGHRIFSTRDLRVAQHDGAPGETVLMQVIRDEQTLEIYLPRGPVGVNTGGGIRLPPGATP